MKCRQITMKSPLVLATIGKFKTVTRRVVRIDPASGYIVDRSWKRRWHRDDPDAVLACPYGAPGDRLWIRESGLISDDKDAFQYADHKTRFEPGAPQNHARGYKWCPSIFMPRWACRAVVEIVSVRVERLQEITDDEVLLEGVLKDRGPGETWYAGKAREIFARGWDDINGPGAWDLNPWVWRIEYKLVACWEEAPAASLEGVNKCLDTKECRSGISSSSPRASSRQSHGDERTPASPRKSSARQKLRTSDTQAPLLDR